MRYYSQFIDSFAFFWDATETEIPDEENVEDDLSPIAAQIKNMSGEEIGNLLIELKSKSRKFRDVAKDVLKTRQKKISRVPGSKRELHDILRRCYELENRLCFPLNHPRADLDSASKEPSLMTTEELIQSVKPHEVKVKLMKQRLMDNRPLTAEVFQDPIIK